MSAPIERRTPSSWSRSSPRRCSATNGRTSTATRSGGSFDPDGDYSRLWDLDLLDILLGGWDVGDRGKNPAAHIGDSESYFVVREGATAGEHVTTDYKAAGGGATYNALTFLLVDAGERHRNRPEGPLTDREVWAAW